MIVDSATFSGRLAITCSVDGITAVVLTMMKVNRYKATSAVPAIAAVLALLSTPAIAQEVPPQSAQPPQAVPPVTRPTPSPIVTDPAPVSTDTAPAPSDPLAPAADDSTAAAADAPAAKAKPRTVAKTATRAAPVKAAPKASHAAPAAAAAPVAAAPVAAPAVSTAAVDPIVDTQPAAPATPAKSVAKPAFGPDERTMELGGGALALLALGAGAFAMSRRRRQDDLIDEDTYVDEPMTEAEPVVASEPVLAAEPMVEPASRSDLAAAEEQSFIAPPLSAFSWGNRAPEAATAVEDDGSDRRDGETWVERAYRGPSPANPSASLKNRLRRAAFFDKRERDVAAGTAKPVDAGAGLPDAVMESREPELA